VPYLSADETKISWWRGWLNEQIPTENKRVGLVWAGNPVHSNDANRSIDFSELAAFSDVKNVTFVSLQLGEKAQKDTKIVRESITILDAAPHIKDFTDTAALLSALDLLITVDSAPAHLAGALNLPVWTLITKVPDWRWLLERDDSVWYKSTRLFRQPEVGDWVSVLRDVKIALEQL
jgi:ADP-heptose:LPS heptosyltransferase